MKRIKWLGLVFCLGAGLAAAGVSVPLASANGLTAAITCTGVTFANAGAFPEDTHAKLYISDNAIYLPGANGDEVIISKSTGVPPAFPVNFTAGTHTVQVVVTWHNSDGNGDFNSHPVTIYCAPPTTTTTPTTTVVTTTTNTTTVTTPGTTTTLPAVTTPGATTTLPAVTTPGVATSTEVPGPPETTTVTQTVTAPPVTLPAVTTAVTTPGATKYVTKFKTKIKNHVVTKVKTVVKIKNHVKTVYKIRPKFVTVIKYVVKNHKVIKKMFVVRTKLVHSAPKVIVKWKTKVVVKKILVPGKTISVCTGPGSVKLPNGQCGFRGNG